MSRVVLTAIGADRPGLVEEVSEFLLERGGSIEESRMANLLGQFAIALLVTGDDDAVARIVGDVDVLRRETGIDATFTPVGGEPAPAGRHYRFEAKAADQPGLVHRVADVLRRFDANIEQLDTTLEAAPITGTPTFAMSIVLSVPTGVAIEDVQQELERICAELDLDWRLEAAER
jgi:glycine cleavage system transcriptional repressor